MAIVKTVRKTGRAIGRVVDAEDRQYLAMAVVYVGTGGGIILALGAFAGLAIRLFYLTSGG